MPYSKTYNSYKRYVPRKYTARSVRRGRRMSTYNTWRRYGASAGGLAYKAYKTAKFVKSVINTEYKYYDGFVNHNVLPTITWFPFTSVPQGDDMDQRDGRSILLKSIQYRLKLQLTGTLRAANFRIVILRYNSCNGNGPVGSEIYTNPANINSWRNIKTGPAANYTIILDKRYSLDQDYKDTILIEKYMKMSDHIKYIGTTATTASCGPGSYFVGFWTDVSTVDPNNLNVSGDFRIRFIDN